jgi:hypothetical protein
MLTKRSLPIVIALVTLLTSSSRVQPAVAADNVSTLNNANLVSNPSFEQFMPAKLPRAWRGDPLVYAGDSHERHSGASSLRFENAAADRYRLCSQTVPLPPGCKCRSATITVACYVRRGMTGTAWFDDVELLRVVDPPMQVVVRSPVYRGWITSQGPEQAQVHILLNLHDHDIPPQDVRLHARLRDSSGATRWELPAMTGKESGNAMDVVVPVRGLVPGIYDLELRLTGPDGKELQTAHQQLQRLADNFQPHCCIDEHRRLLVDGKPFFPLGMYFSGIHEADLKTYSASKFNCLMPYEPPNVMQMDLAARYGLKVIYSLKDFYIGTPHCPPNVRSEADEEPLVRARVRQFREHPALLAWYLNDELSLKYLARVEAHQRWVAEEDAGHPTWSVLYQVDDISAYINSFDCIGSDPYPIARKPASLAGQWTAETFRQVARSRAVWQVPQAFTWGNYNKNEPQKMHDRTPSFEEERSMAWQCICEGATGLVFYSWFDLKRNPDAPFDKHWEGLQRIAAEIDGLAPALLSIEPVRHVTMYGATSSHDAPAWLHFIGRQHDGKLYLFAVNDGDGEGVATFRLPRPPNKVRVLGESRALVAHGSVIQDEFRKLGVHIYEIE